ncbi:Zinc metalloproteinase nas-1 [Armadillidium vulgare]|nr:Zinc metalloproteinase nas-1 [Armadillidium vulgare]
MTTNTPKITSMTSDIRTKPEAIVNKQRECSSDIGRRKNRQEVDLAQFCLDRGTILHELNHVVGFEHEHVRPDRDQYIEVIWDNFTSEG